MLPSGGFFRNVYFQPYNDRGSAGVINSSKNSKYFVQQLDLEKVLKFHQGSVNSVNWNDSGSLLLSAGDDKHIVITNPFTYKILVDYKTQHTANIFCAKFLPTSDNRVISCSAGGAVLNLDLERLNETEQNFFYCHSAPCFKLETIHDEPNIILSCSEDGTVRQYDLRTSVKCTKKPCYDNILVDCGIPVSTIAISPVKPYQLAIATGDSMVRIVDRRKIMKNELFQKIETEFAFTVPSLSHRAYRITSLAYSPDGRDVLASYSNEEIYLFSLHKNPYFCTDNCANDFLENPRNPPPYRRIRLKGDLEDTGPDALPSFGMNDHHYRRRTFSIGLMDQLSRILIDVFNSPLLISIVMQQPRSDYSPEVTESLRRIMSKIDKQGEFIVPRNINIMENYRANSNENDIVTPTSNSNNQRDENKVNVYKKPPVFDDFIKLQSIKKQYTGHRNSRTLFKQATFWGNDFIMSGSDCGHVFVWDRYTCEIVMLLEADNRVVNCIQPHPSRLLLATSGIDHNVKLWSPKFDIHSIFHEPFFTEQLVEKNKLMMEQSRYTITVSPTIIIRILSFFNELKQGAFLNRTNTIE